MQNNQNAIEGEEEEKKEEPPSPIGDDNVIERAISSNDA